MEVSSVSPASLNLFIAFLSQQEQMVLVNMCKGKKGMVDIMQNQQVRNGAENLIIFSFADDELL